MALLRSLGTVFGVGMVIGLGGLLAIPRPLEEPKPLFNRGRVADLPIVAPAVPCSDQAWPMMDRRCATWTATRPADEPRAAKAEPRGKLGKNELRPSKPGKEEPRLGTVGQASSAQALAGAPAPSAGAEPAVAPAPAKEPKLEPAADGAAAQAQGPDPAVARSADERAPKSRRAHKPRNSDRGRRAVAVNPSLRPDAMYYAARRNTSVGGWSPFW